MGGVDLSYDAAGNVTGMTFAKAPRAPRAPRDPRKANLLGRGGGLSISIHGLEELGASLHELERRLPLAIRESLRGDGGDALASAMRMGAPSRSGTLRGGIGVFADGDGAMVGYRGAAAKFSGVAGARDQRGAWVESGTKPHTIKPRDGGAMLWGGKFVEEVHHPGSRARGVAKKAINTAEWEVLADIVDKLERIG